MIDERRGLKLYEGQLTDNGHCLENNFPSNLEVSYDPNMVEFSKKSTSGSNKLGYHHNQDTYRPQHIALYVSFSLWDSVLAILILVTQNKCAY